MGNEHSIDSENCVICSRKKMFDGEGRIVKGYWFCCWNCIEKGKQNGLVNEGDIRNG